MALSQCVNCCAPLTEKTKVVGANIANVNRIAIGISIDTSACVQLTVTAALNYIYQSSGKQIVLSNDHGPVEELGVCITCWNIVIQLYQLHKSLHNLTKVNSLLNQAFKVLGGPKVDLSQIKNSPSTPVQKPVTKPGLSPPVVLSGIGIKSSPAPATKPGGQKIEKKATEPKSTKSPVPTSSSDAQGSTQIQSSKVSTESPKVVTYEAPDSVDESVIAPVELNVIPNNPEPLSPLKIVSSYTIPPPAVEDPQNIPGGKAKLPAPPRKSSCVITAAHLFRQNLDNSASLVKQNVTIPEISASAIASQVQALIQIPSIKPNILATRLLRGAGPRVTGPIAQPPAVSTMSQGQSPLNKIPAAVPAKTPTANVTIRPPFSVVKPNAAALGGKAPLANKPQTTAFEKTKIIILGSPVTAPSSKSALNPNNKTKSIPEAKTAVASSAKRPANYSKPGAGAVSLTPESNSASELNTEVKSKSRCPRKEKTQVRGVGHDIIISEHLLESEVEVETTSPELDPLKKNTAGSAKRSAQNQSAGSAKKPKFATPSSSASRSEQELLPEPVREKTPEPKVPPTPSPFMLRILRRVAQVIDKPKTEGIEKSTSGGEANSRKISLKIKRPVQSQPDTRDQDPDSEFEANDGQDAADNHEETINAGTIPANSRSRIHIFNYRYSGCCSEPNCTHWFQSSSRHQIHNHFRTAHGRNIQFREFCHVCEKMVDTKIIDKYSHLKSHPVPPETLIENFKKYNAPFLKTKCGLNLTRDEITVDDGKSGPRRVPVIIKSSLQAKLQKRLGALGRPQQQKYVVSVPKPCACPLCGLLFVKQRYLYRHNPLCHDKKELCVCPICEMPLPDYNESWNTHVLAHLSPEERSSMEKAVEGFKHARTRKYTCHKCGDVLKSKLSLKCHSRLHLLPDEKVNKMKRCTEPYCTYTTLRSSSLKNHKLAKHTASLRDNQGPHICDLCHKRYKGKQGLERHYTDFHQMDREESRALVYPALPLQVFAGPRRVRPASSEATPKPTRKRSHQKKK